MVTTQRKPKQLGQILLEQGLVTEEHLQRALEEHRNTPKSLGRVLIDLGYIHERDLVRALAEQVGLEFVDLPQGPPPTQTFPRMCQIEIVGICQALPWTGYTTNTFSACSAASAFLTSGTLTGNQLVWIPTVCDLAIANNASINFTGNLAIVTNGSITMANRNDWNWGTGNNLYFIVNHRSILPTSCSSTYNITTGNNSNFNNAAVLFYSPCTVTLNNQNDFLGQVIGNSVVINNNFTMSATSVLVPGVGEVNGFNESIVYVREVAD
jgi:hypothetical protein